MPLFRSARNRNNASQSSNGNATSPSSSSNPVVPTNAIITNSNDPDADNSGVNEDAPPAYTPAADARLGESTIEVGPRRPFQSAPQQPQRQLQVLSPQPTPSTTSTTVTRPSTHGRSHSHSRTSNRQQSVSQQPSGTNLAVQQQPPRRPSSAGALPGPERSAGADLLAYTSQLLQNSLYPPPPKHPSSSASSSTSSNTAARSEFARHFYAAGSLPDGSGNDPAPTRRRRASSSSPYLPPPGPPPGASSSTAQANSSSLLSPNITGVTSDFALDFYAAGDGVPGVSSSSGSRYAPPAGSPPSNASNSNNIPNDGKPTRTPVPGHPLLRDNQTLVYPAGYTCEKCNNTGYKHNDPSHPCRKCWTKYGKPYTGALLYTTWTPEQSAPGSKYTFQQPLPRLRPAASLPSVSTLSGPSSPRSPQGHGRAISQGSPQRLQPQPRIEFADPIHNPPPPGALVVPPGDPRLGGVQCWRCGGSGVIPFFIFDGTQCGLCGGSGRVY